MHELSIALSLLNVAAEEAQRLDAPVVAVHLKLGLLSGVVPEALKSAYELACENTPLAGSRLVIQKMPLIAWCPLCAREQRIPSPQYICCPICDTPTPDIRGGRELEVTAIEVPNDSADTPGRSPAASAQAQ